MRLHRQQRMAPKSKEVIAAANVPDAQKRAPDLRDGGLAVAVLRGRLWRGGITGAGKALRSIFLLGVKGMAGNVTMACGTMISGRWAASCRRAASLSTAASATT